MQVHQGMDDVTVPFAFGVDLDPIANLNALGSLTLDGSATVDLVLGIDLDDASFFVDDLGVSGEVGLAVNQFSAGAKFGFVDITVGQANAA